jgi:putative Mg2+ transporter-C (MgtC) family protein
LGAGTILFTGSAITGLTTAASIWVTAAIGLAVGAGFFYASVVTTILVFLILWLVNIIEKRLFENKSVKRLKITGVDGLLRLSDLASLLSERSVVVRNIALEHNAGQSEESKTVTLTLSVRLPKRDQNLLTLAEELHKLPGIQSVQTD